MHNSVCCYDAAVITLAWMLTWHVKLSMCKPKVPAAGKRLLLAFPTAFRHPMHKRLSLQDTVGMWGRRHES
jgi:hypothetical protein